MTVRYDQYAGVDLVINEVPSSYKITLASAKGAGAFPVQPIQDIAPGKYSAKLNAGFFCDQRNSAIYGQPYGIRCGADEWEVPRQNAFVYYAVLPDGRTEVGYDSGFWYTRETCQMAYSPALVLMHNGMDVEWISPSRRDRRTLACRQSVLVRTKTAWLSVITKGNLSPDQIRAWARSVPGVQDLVFNDGGGSACIADGDALYTATGENRAIANAIAWEGTAGTLPKTETGGAMTLKGIDISNWQAGLDLSKIDFDFVILKATQGTSFVDRYCDGFYQKAKSMGKLLGFYHYGMPANDPVAEARFFVENTRNYFGEAIPVLDIEEHSATVVDWCVKFLQEVIRLTGVKPMIYMSEQSFNWRYDWTPVVALDCGLWIAKYRDNSPDYNYDMSAAGSAPKVKYWPGYAMWQWTSVGRLTGYNGNLDCDIFYGNEATWKAYATSKPVTNEPEPEPEPEDEEIRKLKAKITALEEENEDLWEAVKQLKMRIEAAITTLRGEES